MEHIVNISKFGIFGLGKTGSSTYNFLKDKIENIICFDDDINVISKFIARFPEAKIASLDFEGWSDCDFFVISPGVPLLYPRIHPLVLISRKYNVKIISDIDVFYHFNPNKYYIGITGTNGKSTCTALLAHIFRCAGEDFLSVGNIGDAICDASLEAKGYVIELSSYQIELTSWLKLNSALCLNITPDHNDRYPRFQDYSSAKLKIFNFLIDRNNGVNWAINSPLDFTSDNFKDNPNLLGDHNKQNIAACYELAKIYGIKSIDILRSVGSFPGLKHRLQYLGIKNNIKFFNDSKATNNEATSKALLSLNNIYWLAGGLHKTKELSSLITYISSVKKAYFFGDAKNCFFDYLHPYIECQIFNNLHDATAAAYADACLDSAISNILLSPASASFDQFKNFEDRGEAFIRIFNNL